MTTAIRPRRGISSDPRHLTPAQVDALRALARSMPGAGNARLATAFAATTGRPISESTARKLLGRRRPPTPRKPPRNLAVPDAVPVLPADVYPDLPRPQAARLAWIAANRPELTPIECVAQLAAEMGGAS